MMSGLPAMQSPQNASRAPQEHAPGIDTDSHSQPFADSAIESLFGSLVPPRPLSQRRFDHLGRVVVSVVGCT